MLLSVIEYAQNPVAIADYDTGRLLSQPRRNAPDGTDRRGLVAARWAPEFFTDVGFVQAPDMESTLLDQGKGEGQAEFRHFLTGEPIPVTRPGPHRRPPPQWRGRRATAPGESPGRAEPPGADTPRVVLRIVEVVDFRDERSDLRGRRVELETRVEVAADDLVADDASAFA
ncbi:hypothetical protein [Rhodococcus opacus]|uniref:hypothetical protein n=1 Tax=Rhodococcus opacus TaxID=37919 RepID=UPI002955AB3D|nr:hypothetical protein [Rhodococcus opacus]MDV7084035.1 hypothetical protein [Rhodococcus opacus]